MNDICELTIYTSDAVLTFDVCATTSDFQDRLAAALEDGSVVLDTVEGSRLVLNAINVVAIEIHDVSTAEIASNTPPIKNN